MAVNESSLGLKKLEIGDVQPTGLPSSWTELEDVVVGSTTLSETEPSTTNIFIEQKQGVYRNITTEDGVITLVTEVYDVSPANIALLKGGTVDAATPAKGSTWKGDVETVEITKALRLTTLDDYIITIANGKLVCVFNWIASKQDLAKLTITVTVQASLDSNTPSISVEAPDKTA